MEAVRTDDGSLTIKHVKHDEAYHSTLGARTEALELYINRSSIQKHFASNEITTVLDVGLGLGYNALTTIDTWNQSPQRLNLMSLESDREILAEFLSGHAVWQTEWSTQWQIWAQSPKQFTHEEYQCKLSEASQILDWQIHLGNALEFDFAKHMTSKKINFIWHDPFSPTKNPLMWSRDWFERIKPYCAPGCELLTYSVARPVKDALSHAGWQIERLQGLGAKKHWLRAMLPV